MDREEIVEIITELKDLNEMLYEELTTRLDQYGETLSPEMYKFVQEKIFERYKYVSNRLWKEREVARENVMFELEERSAIHVARRSRFLRRKNRPAKLKVRELDIEAEKYFRPREKRCDELEEALENEDAIGTVEIKECEEARVAEEKGARWVDTR